MVTFRYPKAWREPPLVLQILGLLLGGLVVAQLVTLLLTIVFPPAPKPQHSLAALAAALAGAPRTAASDDRIERRLQAGPPDISGPGWLVSEPLRQDLAGLLRVDPARVRLAFYTPLPFAGTATAATLPVSPPFLLAGYDLFGQPGGGGGGSGGGGGGGQMGGIGGAGFSGGGFSGGRFSGRRDGRSGDAGVQSRQPERGNGGDGGGDRDPAERHDVAPASRPDDGPSPVVRALSPARHRPGPGVPAGGRAPGRIEAFPGLSSLRFDTFTLPPNAVRDDSAPTAEPPPPPTAPVAQRHEHPRAAVVAEAPPIAAPEPAVSAPPARMTRTAASLPSHQLPIPVTPPPRGLFGLAPAPFVEGQFVAAVQRADGRWAVVQPAPEAFPNAWQSRVLLWFAIAFALVAPVGWLFARGIVKPLSRFAAAAEQLGRDPSSLILQLDGPAEVGRAAHAFNLMQSRLKSFVDDRTAMVGAISHDLRTPLTRLRFRMEDVEDEAVREGMIEEVVEMEAMISSVLAFIRDASTPGARERLDFRSIVEEVVEDHRLIGSHVELEAGGPAPVEVDVLGMRRLLGNLVDNATKYGEHARIRLVIDLDEARADIIDDGPGLPEDELERAFEPFYRSSDAHASDKRGSGLGLAVCRSIARAHGGDVRLLRSSEGFVAQLRVPLAYDGARPLAA